MKKRLLHDPGDWRGDRLKFRFRTRSTGLRAEVGGWKNKKEARQCVMYSEVDRESVEHVLMRCIAYRSERKQLWEVMEVVECEGWGWLEEEEVKVLLWQDTVCVWRELNLANLASGSKIVKLT